MTQGQLRKSIAAQKARVEALRTVIAREADTLAMLTQLHDARKRALAATETALGKELELLAVMEKAGVKKVPLSRVPTSGTMEDMLGPDSRALKIARTKTAGGRPAEVEALYNAGLTPQTAAEILGTTRDVLKQAWAQGRQFRPLKPAWRKKLAEHNVPESVWRDKP